MQQNGLIPKPFSIRISVTALVTVVLWLVAVVMTAVCVFALRELLLWATAALLASPNRREQLQAANAINLAHQCGMIILGIVDLGVILVITELFFKHIGQPRFMRTLVVIILVETAIVLPTALLFWR
jgi:hypothetical protein